MEYIANNERTFLEDLLALRGPSSDHDYYFPNPEHNYFNPNNLIWTTTSVTADSCYLSPSPNFPISNSDPYTPFDDYSALLSDQALPYGGAPFSPPDFTVDGNIEDQTLPNYANCQDQYTCYDALAREEGDGGAPFNVGPAGAPCKVESLPELPGAAAFEVGSCPPGPTDSNKSKVKKVSGQPSKNLMAERRRRKRLNDRLSMLRSVVPKISKMDRTSILGDTIDYMKELLERINTLQEDMQVGSDQLGIMSIFKDAKPNELLVRNSPKFEVERRSEDTRIEICCGGKPGLLLSTVTTLEALGLEFKQCVISCFNDFALQASCSDGMKKRAMLDSEDIKQALLRNAGYGAKCV